MMIYVNASAPKDGDGSKSSPFRRINDAAKTAVPGDEIIVAPGIYREYVNPVNAGTEDARIIYRSETPLGAIITGAEEVKGWCPYEGSVWVCRIDNGIFGDYNPYTTLISGDWFYGTHVIHTGAVYLNDHHMYETETLEECLAGERYAPSWEPEWSAYKWYSERFWYHKGCVNMGSAGGVSGWSNWTALV